MTTGFIGLGNLGRAMAARLIAQGEKLTVWNRTRAKAESLDATPVDSPAALVNRCDVVILNLFDSPAVKEVLTGPDGLLEGDCRGKVIIDTTTNHFAQVPEFYQLIAQAGGAYLEAPVMGSVIPASQGALTILVGGDPDVLQQVHKLLEKLAKNIYYLDGPTAATRMKLVNNMVLGSFMATLAEAAVFAEACDIKRSQVLEILAAGAGNSGVLNAKRQKLAEDDFSPHFSAAAIYKDLLYAKDLAAELKRPYLMAGMAREIYALVQNRGDDTRDFSVVFDFLQGLKT